MAKMVMQTQAGAYYDPETETFYVVMPDLPEQALDSVYSHELYHGFQDQHFGLNSYLMDLVKEGQLNDDQIMARQAIVEGEATYMMTLWTTKAMMGSLPPTQMLKMVIDMQADLSTQQLLEMTKLALQTNISAGGSAQTMVDAVNNIPGFIIDSMVGAYMKGMRFVFEVHQDDWSNVNALYENPPVSTEQILHPEKWISGEEPYQYTWPDFSNEKSTRNWALLEQNTLGEMQWRSVFTEYGMVGVSTAAAAGWDGDSYSIIENPEDNNIVLMLATSWDTEDEATEFKNAYSILSALKLKDYGDSCRHLQQKAKDVLIMESTKPTECETFIGLLDKVKKDK